MKTKQYCVIIDYGDAPQITTFDYSSTGLAEAQQLVTDKAKKANLEEDVVFTFGSRVIAEVFFDDHQLFLIQS